MHHTRTHEAEDTSATSNPFFRPYSNLSSALTSTPSIPPTLFPASSARISPQPFLPIHLCKLAQHSTSSHNIQPILHHSRPSFVTAALLLCSSMIPAIQHVITWLCTVGNKRGLGRKRSKAKNSVARSFCYPCFRVPCTLMIPDSVHTIKPPS